MKKQVLDIPVHSLIIIVGASDDDREALCNEKLIPELSAIKRSGALMFNNIVNIEKATSYPLNTNFVIVGKSVDQSAVEEVAVKNNYNVVSLVFDKTLMSGKHKKQKGNIELLVEDLENTQFKSSSSTELSTHYLDPSKEWIVFGDVHGCLDEFKELVAKHFHIYDNGLCGMDPTKRILSVGDIIDKGPKVKETIEFFYKNWKTGMFYLTVGNHENWVYKYLKGIIPAKSVEPGLIENYFDTVLLLQKDEELKNKFFELVEGAKSFYLHRDFVVTHAPCRKKYIGKLHGKSIKHQQHIMYPKAKKAKKTIDKVIDFIFSVFGQKSKKQKERDAEYVKEIESFFSFLIKESALKDPTHIFGHIACDYMSVINKINIDGGCYKGGMLKYVIAKPGAKLSSIDGIKSKQKKSSEGLLQFFLH